MANSHHLHSQPWIVQVIPKAGGGSRRPSVSAAHRAFQRERVSVLGITTGFLSLSCVWIQASTTNSGVELEKRFLRRCPFTMTSARHCCRSPSHLRVPSTSQTLPSTAPWGRDRTVESVNKKGWEPVSPHPGVTYGGVDGTRTRGLRRDSPLWR